MYRHVVSIALLVICCSDLLRAEDRSPRAEPKLSPMLRDVVRAIGASKILEQDAVDAALRRLAKARSWKQADYSSLVVLHESKCIVRRWHMIDYVVVILNGGIPATPGPNEWRLLLLDTEGNVVDRVSCTISNRLWVIGSYEAKIPKHPKKENVDVVIRFVPHEKGRHLRGNWDHEITYRGREWAFPWDAQDYERGKRPDWEKNGLCRVRVGQGRFDVTFPSLPKENGRELKD